VNVLRRRSRLARWLRAPGLLRSHYVILRRADDNFRGRALLVALRLTWAALR